MNVQALTLDLSKKSETTPIIRIGQGDKNGTTLQVTITDESLRSYETISGSSSVLFRMKKPNGTYYSVAGSWSSSKARFTIDETDAAAVPGITDVAYIELTNPRIFANPPGGGINTRIVNGVFSTERFRVVIEKSARV